MPHHISHLPPPSLLQSAMEDIALDVQERLSVLNATQPSNTNIQVNDLSHCVASLNGPAVGVVVVVVTSSLIHTVGNWCRSSQNQSYVPIIYRPEDLVLVPNQGQFALCLFDDALRIWSSTLFEVSLIATEVNECFKKILNDFSMGHSPRNENLDHLIFDGTFPLKPVVFHNWLDEIDCRERAIQTPFMLEPSNLEGIPVPPENIFWKPPTPIASPFMTLSPLSPFSDPDSLSSAFSSPTSSPSGSPGYLELNSGRYNSSMNFILNDIPLQGTVSPRDVFPQGKLVDDDLMDADSSLLQSPSAFLDSSLANSTCHYTSKSNDGSSLSPSHLEVSPAVPSPRLRTQQFPSTHFLPSPSPSNYARSSSSLLSPHPSAPSLSDSTLSSVSSRRQSRPSLLTSSASSHTGLRAPLSRKVTKKNKILSDDDDKDDEYTPVQHARGSGVRKTAHVMRRAKKIVGDDRERRPSSVVARALSGQRTKFPQNHSCLHCFKKFTRGTDVTRHLLTCERNPDRERKGPCHYCAEDAPIRGDSAKRHWRSDACHFAAISRGITPYPRDTD